MGKEWFPSPRVRAVRLVRDADALHEIVTSRIALENLEWRVMLQTYKKAGAILKRLFEPHQRPVAYLRCLACGDAYAVEITDDH